MRTVYDPYHKLLGISRSDQPPTAYRLLGIDRFEQDRDVIDIAANKQMAYLQGCCNGEHAAAAERLLNEVSEARLRLLHPRSKAQYDEELRAASPQSLAADPIPLTPPSVPERVPAAARPSLVIDEASMPTPVIRTGARDRRKGSGSLRWVLPVFVPFILSVFVAGKLELTGSAPVEETVAQNTPARLESSLEQPVIDSQTMANDSHRPHITGEPRHSAPFPEQITTATLPLDSISSAPDAPASGPPNNQSAQEQERLDSFRAMAQGTDSSETSSTTLATNGLSDGLRSPMPSEVELGAARQEVQETLAHQIRAAARSSHEKQHLATVCYEIAAETQREAAKYALLQFARDYFVEVNDFAGEMLVLDAMEAGFDVDLFQDRVSSLTRIVPAIYRPLEQVDIADRAEALIATAMLQEEYAAALELCGLCNKLAKEFKNLSMAKKFAMKLDEAVLLQSVAPTVEMARQRLQQQPDNAKANEYLGRFLCFGKSQWNEGLSRLRFAEDQNLVDLAELELQTRSSAVDHLELADRWWEFALASDQDPMLVQEGQTRAVYWYRHAIAAGLSGLSKAAAQSRIDAFAAAQGDTWEIQSTPNADLREPKPPRGVPRGAIHFNGNWYLFSSETLHFREATLKAKQMNARLAVVRSQAEHDFILQHARRSFMLGVLLKDGIWYDALGEQQYFFLWDHRVGTPADPTKPLIGMHKRSQGWVDIADSPLYYVIEWGKE